MAGASALDDLLSANRYGGEGKAQASLSQVMGQNRYLSRSPEAEAALAAGLIELVPEHPHDVDCGPLFCVQARRCFLDGGKRCGTYQAGNRNKGMITDLSGAVTESGFFFMQNTMIDESMISTLYRHLGVAIATPPSSEFAAQGEEPGARGLALQVAGNKGAGILGKHSCLSIAGGTHASANRWPKEDPIFNFQQDLEEAWELMDTVGENLAKGVSSMLGIPIDTFSAFRSASTHSPLMLLDFPACPTGTKAGPAGSEGFVTEPGLFLIVNQTKPTLQIKDHQGRTCELRVGPERFIVIIGEAFAKITNGAVPATKFRFNARNHHHQVICFASRLDEGAEVKAHELYL